MDPWETMQAVYPSFFSFYQYYSMAKVGPKPLSSLFGEIIAREIFAIFANFEQIHKTFSRKPMKFFYSRKCM